MAAYDDACPEARAAYDAAETAAAEAWDVYDAAARNPDTDDLPAWEAYRAALGPLEQATSALFTQPQPQAQRQAAGEWTLFDIPEGATDAAA